MKTLILFVALLIVSGASSQHTYNLRTFRTPHHCPEGYPLLYYLIEDIEYLPDERDKIYFYEDSIYLKTVNYKNQTFVINYVDSITVTEDDDFAFHLPQGGYTHIAKLSLLGKVYRYNVYLKDDDFPYDVFTNEDKSVVYFLLVSSLYSSEVFGKPSYLLINFSTVNENPLNPSELILDVSKEQSFGLPK